MQSRQTCAENENRKERKGEILREKKRKRCC